VKIHSDGLDLGAHGRPRQPEEELPPPGRLRENPLRRPLLWRPGAPPAAGKDIPARRPSSQEAAQTGFACCIIQKTERKRRVKGKAQVATGGIADKAPYRLCLCGHAPCKKRLHGSRPHRSPPFAKHKIFYVTLRHPLFFCGAVSPPPPPSGGSNPCATPPRSPVRPPRRRPRARLPFRLRASPPFIPPAGGIGRRGEAPRLQGTRRGRSRPASARGGLTLRALCARGADHRHPASQLNGKTGTAQGRHGYASGAPGKAKRHAFCAGLW